MRRMIEVVVIMFFLLAVAMAGLVTIKACTEIVYADEGDTAIMSMVMDAITKLRPNITQDRAGDLATAFVDASQETELDPFLLVAVARRESGLRPSVVGKLGERGLLQIHGVGLRHRPSTCGRTLKTPHCQVRTGAAFIQWVRATCPGSTWRWVCSYGRSQCCTEEQARRDRGTILAHDYHQEIGGSPW